jgi:Ner family transcriptional regulator
MSLSAKDWDWHRIKMELHRRGCTLRKIAELYQLSYDYVRHVPKNPSPAVEDAIADFLGEDPEVIWAWRRNTSATKTLNPHPRSKLAQKASPKVTAVDAAHQDGRAA